MLEPDVARRERLSALVVLEVALPRLRALLTRAAAEAS